MHVWSSDERTSSETRQRRVDISTKSPGGALESSVPPAPAMRVPSVRRCAARVSQKERSAPAKSVYLRFAPLPPARAPTTAHFEQAPGAILPKRSTACGPSGRICSVPLAAATRQKWFISGGDELRLEPPALGRGTEMCRVPSSPSPHACGAAARRVALLKYCGLEIPLATSGRSQRRGKRVPPAGSEGSRAMGRGGERGHAARLLACSGPPEQAATTTLGMPPGPGDALRHRSRRAPACTARETGTGSARSVIVQSAQGLSLRRAASRLSEGRLLGMRAK